MLYVDKNIKERASEIFVSGYDPEMTGPVSHDLTIQNIIAGDGKTVDDYTLQPGEMAMVNTNQVIQMPVDLLGRIGEKNSRIRQGLLVSGPHYFPGHKTRIILRVFNCSSYAIEIESGDSIAQIFFEELKDRPEKDYSQRADASFNNETNYSGFGKYKSAYEKRMKKMKDMEEDLNEKENRIYANIITLMGIFVSIFSLIMVNFSSKRLATGSSLVHLNLSLGFAITLMLGAILLFINHREVKSKAAIFIYITLLIALLIALVIV
ncbi:dCTP deaminase domain-containing protein [Eubacterium pyruvativorans]|uniref:dCTP deaminase domain-containing protein n=1 Tax=Eubacterium pyruvativorans TaxID=155865 RepID=UPI00088C1471|nr:hypothetical protein [Eubacterium pyruvativorans]SDF31975.1 deoxycytidine triphosphate deaminase [Eubacterium pyruvativorans]